MADINLLNNTYTILSRDQFGYLWIQYVLDAVPSEKWNKIFSRKSSLYSIYNDKLTNKILVYLTPLEWNEELLDRQEEFEEFATPIIQCSGIITDAIIQKIQQTNEEINSDSLKVAIILSKFENGMIVVHDGMHYTALHTVPTAPNPITIQYLNQYRDDLQFNRDHYESYVTAIANSI